MNRTRLKRAELARLGEFSPVNHDFRWNEDGSVDIFELVWWDDATYRAYQCRDLGGEPSTDNRERIILLLPVHPTEGPSNLPRLPWIDEPIPF